MNHKCLTCRNWARTDDKLVGLCVVHQGYRFQLEDCAAYAFGESRARSGFTELPKPKAKPKLKPPRVRHVSYRMIVEQNSEQVRAWKAEGKSFSWMAQKLDIPIRYSCLVSRYFVQGGA